MVWDLLFQVLVRHKLESSDLSVGRDRVLSIRISFIANAQSSIRTSGNPAVPRGPAIFRHRRATAIDLREFPFQLKAFSSYGEISRNLLTRKIMGGIIPWEIFIADVLALPGQRASWKIPIFLHACPTELVLRDSVYKTFYPSQGGAPAKLPQRLTVGIESQNSLTKGQSREWLSHWKYGASIELVFRMLPMDMMIHALEAEALDAIIAPSPWGIHAESTGLGKRDPRFSPGKFAQRLVMVCHRDFLEQHPDLSLTLAQGMAGAQTRLKDPATFTKSIERMSRCGRPLVQETSSRKRPHSIPFPRWTRTRSLTCRNSSPSSWHSTTSPSSRARSPRVSKPRDCCYPPRLVSLPG